MPLADSAYPTGDPALTVWPMIQTAEGPRCMTLLEKVARDREIAQLQEIQARNALALFNAQRRRGSSIISISDDDDVEKMQE